jgi:RNA polymerase sigma-70 factor (ECF subfamily)
MIAPMVERAGFEQEVLAQLDALYSFALRLTRNHHDAEDLVSDTVVRALHNWERYTPGTNARAWLFKMQYHLFVSRMRKWKREVPLSEFVNEGSSFEIVGDTDPEGTFYDSIVDDEITRAIDALPEDYRSVVVLSDVHGMRYAEIGEILAVPEGTVKSRLFRGRRILQKKLTRYAVEMGYLPSDRTQFVLSDHFIRTSSIEAPGGPRAQRTASSHERR